MWTEYVVSGINYSGRANELLPGNRMQAIGVFT